jgi:phage-related protein
MSTARKPLVWLHGEIKTPMPSVGAGCHELRVRDETRNWRIIYRIDDDAIIIAEVFPKTTQKTPKQVIDACKRRLVLYDASA